MAKATSVYICIFTNKPTNSGNGYAPELLGQPEAGMYAAVSDAANQLFSQEGLEGTALSMCYAPSPDFKAFFEQANVSAPVIGIIGAFSDGTKKYYTLKNTANVKDYIRSMWLGEFGGTTPLPTNLGDGEGGWGEGNALICRLIPPLCALGFLPWLALAGIATYKAAESRSTTGKLMWAAPAALLWAGFFQRGGLKQIQYWMKKL